MTRQTATPIEHRSLSAQGRRAREIARTYIDEFNLDLNPPYQRGSVWTLDQRIGLIRSLLSGIPVPAIILNDRSNPAWADTYGQLDAEDAVFAVIDGKQRIETMVAWYGGEFSVPASWFDPAEVSITEDTDDGPYTRYGWLTRTGQMHFDGSATLPVAEAKVGTVQEEAAIYALVNGYGTPQTGEDMDRARRIAGDRLPS